MLTNYSAPDTDTLEAIELFLASNAPKRIKPTLLRDVKTEALLVFARTALERYFDQIEQNGYKPSLGTPEETAYVYDTLKALTRALQECVINLDYLIVLAKNASRHSKFEQLGRAEAPLIAYYNAMAHKVASHFYNKFTSLPEFLIICTLSHWILEEEKSVHLYPFLEQFDFMSLMDKFEMNREHFLVENECVISDIHAIAIGIIEKLKEKKFKPTPNRVSKTRQKGKKGR